ncbi:MAG: AMP-binding protein, partial [Treponema sp.]|nr:AMP-binding protein [Treponema sp.]
VLPVWHSFERAFTYMIMGLNSGYAYSKPVAPIMLADMAEIHPEWMCAVPRLWESFAKSFYREVKKQGGWNLLIYNIAISIGKQFSWAKNHVFGLVCRFHNYPKIFDTLKGIIPYILLWIPNLISDLLVFRKLRAKLGGRMIAAISGGGTLPPEIDSFYHAIGFNLLEGYGMTETAPVLSVRNSHRPCYGCVGEVFPTMEMKIVAEKDGKVGSMDALPPGKKGMIVVRGRQIMKGYYNRPDLTEATIDKDGWLNTGDLGMMSFDNEIKITGRAKDTIVLQGGENIEPVLIESAIKLSPYVETVVALGQDKKYIACLIVPDKEMLLSYANENSIVYETYESLLETPDVQTLYRSEIDRFMTPEAGFRTCERVFKFLLLPESFKEGEELNSKKVLMRHKIDKIYEKQIKKLFK